MNKKQKKKQVKKIKEHQEIQKAKPKGVVINAPSAASKSKGGF